MENEKIQNHYMDIKNSISNAMENAFSCEYQASEETDFALGVKAELEKLNQDFKTEIDQLEKSTEWEKLCISLFGETNSGKSTILESLRIIYNEQGRLQKILQNQNECEELLQKNNQNYKNLIEQTQNLQKLAKSKKYFSAKMLALSCTITGILAAALTFVLTWFLKV